MDKTKLNRFYLSEKFDEDRNISFNLKKANSKELINFKTFAEGVEEFNRIATTLDGDSKVWFHRDGAFRGSASPETAIRILEKVREAQIKDEEAIEFINREQLVDVSSSKTKKQPVITKKIEVEEEIKRQTPVVKTMSISVDDLNTEVKEISVYITDKEQKLLSEVTLDDVQATSKFNFVATSLRREEAAVVVTYLLRDGNRESKELTTVIKGFKKESSENMPLHYIYHVPRVGWTWAAFLTLGIVCLIAIICIILLSLYMNGLFTLYWK